MGKKTLLVGLQKCGSNWIRFCIFNYFNVLNNKATKTLNWDELEKPHLLRFEKGPEFDDYKDGFPNIHHTHNAWDGQAIFIKYNNCPAFFKKFDLILYIVRNPFDTIISYWHFMMDRNSPKYPLPAKQLEQLKTLEGFTDFYLPKYIHHVKTTKDKAHFILDYDKLRLNTDDLREALKLITDNNVNEEIYQKALKMSSFEEIRKMSEDTYKIGGLGYPYYLGYFCRDGRTGQYKEVMTKELIEKIRTECKKEGLTV